MSDKKTAFFFVLVNGFNTLLNFIFAPYLSRAFSVVENGTYGQVLLVSNLLIIIFSLGISNIYTLLLAEQKTDISKIFTNATAILFLSGLLAIGLQFVFGYYSSELFNNNIKGYLYIFNLSTFFNILSSILTYQLIYSGRSFGLLITTLVFNVLKIAVSVLAIQYFKSLRLFILFLSVVTVLNYLVLFYLVPPAHRKIEMPELSFIKKILSESYPYIILSFLSYSILYIDGWMLSKLLSTYDYAIYRNGAIEIPFIATIYTSISAVMLNKLSLLKQENRIAEMFEIKKRTTQTIAVLTYPAVIFMIVNADILIPIYLSDKYYSSSLVFAIFSLVVLIRINNYSDMLVINKNRFSIIFANAVAFVINIVLNLILIKKFGYVGATVAYVFSILVLAGILTGMTIKSYKVSVHDYYDFKVLLYLVIISSIFIVINKLSFNFGLISFMVSSIFTMTILYLFIIRYTEWIHEDYLPGRLKNVYQFIRKRNSQ